MRRRLGVLAAAFVFVSVPPLGQAPAAAAIHKRSVVSCPSGPSMCWPTAFDFTPRGSTLFYVERFTGQIRRFELGGGGDHFWARIRGIAGNGEQGLLGLTLDPRWRRAHRFHWVYVYFTTRRSGSTINRILRLRKRQGGRVVRDRLLRIPGADLYHNGGVVHIGPDGKLWAVTGEAHRPARAQDKQDLAGKLLRMNLNGSRPRSNPFGGSLAWSFGHRNSFGFAFDPKTGRPWESENGPACNDEVNKIRKGGNFAWGPRSTTCPRTNRSGPRPRIHPEKVYRDPKALTGVAFCKRCGLGRRLRGDLVVGAYNDGKIRALNIIQNRSDVGRQRVLLDNDEGVLAVERRPGGALYFSDPHGIFRLIR